MKVYGLIGYPLGHSFSQKYFTEKFLKLEITDCRYDVFPLPDINDFILLVKNNAQLCGLNITIPHKQNIISFLDDKTHLPKGLSACNCIKIVKGKLIGYNTDVIGFEMSLKEFLAPQHTNALILGNGGAAEAVKFVLEKLGITYKVVSRSLRKDSHITYADLDEAEIKNNLLIVNTTPLGTFPNVNDCPLIPYSHLTSKHYLFDLVYNPAKTLFLQKGEERGAAVKNGFDMLVIQAEESWKIWNETA
jgi:shikimate dehydrogenase